MTQRSSPRPVPMPLSYAAQLASPESCGDSTPSDHGSPFPASYYAGRSRGSHLRVPYRPLPRRWINWKAPCPFPALDLKHFPNPVHEKRGNASLNEPGSVFLFFLIYMKTKDCFPMGSTPSEAFPCFSDFSCTGGRETLH